MRRRTFITTVGLGLSAGCVEQAENTLNGGDHGPVREYRSSLGFTRAGWTDDGLFEISFNDDHGMDGFGVRYHAHDDVRDDIVNEPAPDFSGTKTVDLLSAFDKYDGRPPTGEYQILAYKGSFGPAMNLIEEELGRVSFYIELELELSSPSVTDEYAFEAHVSNNGNSPCLVDAIRIQGTETKVGETILQASERTLKSAPDIFPPDDEDPDCMALIEDFTVELLTLPRVDATVSIEKEYESERVCTIEF